MIPNFEVRIRLDVVLVTVAVIFVLVVIGGFVHVY